MTHSLKLALLNLMFFPIVAVISTINSIRNVYRSGYKYGSLKRAAEVKCLEAFGESYFQFIIQLMILIVTWKGPDALLILSLTTSAISLSLSASASWFAIPR